MGLLLCPYSRREDQKNSESYQNSCRYYVSEWYLNPYSYPTYTFLNIILMFPSAFKTKIQYNNFK